MPTIEYWGFTQIAEHTGLTSGNLRFMSHKGKLPRPDVRVGTNPGWRPKTIEKWWAARTAAASVVQPAGGGRRVTVAKAD